MSGRLGSVGEFCWLDLKTRDVEATSAFLSRTLGWEFTAGRLGERPMTLISTGGHRIGGVSDLANPVYPPGIPPHVAYYLAVDDVDACAKEAIAYGATMVVEPCDIGEQGRLATLVDPVGAAFSLWQPKEFRGWTFPPGTPAAPARMVLACAEPGRAREFYERMLGAPFTSAVFTEADGPEPRWEAAVAVAGEHGPAARVVTPEGIGFPVAVQQRRGDDRRMPAAPRSPSRHERA
ncbi:hypothetical protein BAY59_24000 [Prauserella coralliicola]|nr:hypothetical protein BAY59_24000 [Prauserella coralliicola]